MTHTNATSGRKQFVVSMIILAALYFIFGLVSWVNAILIPYFKIACELNNFQANLVAFAFYIAYFVMSVPASFLLNRAGYKRGMMIGLWIMALGALIFVPAALTRTYGFFLLGLFSLGTGLAILQTAANPYVTIIGPLDTSVRRMSIMGLFNKFAGIIAPLLFAALVMKGLSRETLEMVESGLVASAERTAMLDAMILKVIPPYVGLAIILFLFGLVIRYSILPEIDLEKVNAQEDGGHDSGKSSILHYPYLILGALAIFFHCASQVVSIDTIISYAGTMGVGLIEAKVFPSYVMSFTMFGYCLGVLLIPRVISQKAALKAATVINLCLTILVLTTHGTVTILGHTTDLSIWFIVPMGMSNALIYAGIWPLAIRNLGRFTNLGSSLLIMGLCGNAFGPPIWGLLADRIGAHTAYIMLIPCFLYLIFYAVSGHRITRWNPKKQIV